MEIKKLDKCLRELGVPNYRLKQALRSYYQDLLSSWDGISTWPKQLRADCSELCWSPLKLVKSIKTKEPASIKCLFETTDSLKIESVIMRHNDGRNTVCVSSQVGCAMGCKFCATGKMGLERNLSSEEIVDQVVQAGRILKTSGGRVTNVVFMGMGEPFNNSDEVFRAIHLLIDPDCFGLGARHISVSTCGIVPGIERLMREAPQVNLAISLHATSQSERERIMPVAKAYSLDKVMRAVRVFMQQTNRKVMFEYILLKNVNDSMENAKELADMLYDFRRLSHVNLINYHQTGEFESSSSSTARAFMNALKRRGISVTHRISFGEEISAACGQLATKD